MLYQTTFSVNSFSTSFNHFDLDFLGSKNNFNVQHNNVLHTTTCMIFIVNDYILIFTLSETSRDLKENSFFLHSKTIRKKKYSTHKNITRNI